MTSFIFRNLGALVALFALTISPLYGQETSEEGKSKESQEIEAKVVDGQVIITDGKGNVRVIRLSDAGEGVFAFPSDETGKPRVTVRSKAILVGPDGTQEVILHEEDEGGENAPRVWLRAHEREEVPGRVDLQLSSPESATAAADVLVQLSAMSEGRYMIGVSCVPAGEALKAQLGLEHGLVVESVVDESPASGSIETYDVLVRAGDGDLSDLSDLVDAVRKAGENEEDLEIVLIRAGKKSTVTVTPGKREAPAGALLETGANLDEFKGLLSLEFHPKGLTLEKIGPGMIKMKDDTDHLRSEIEELREELDQLRKELKK